MLDALTITVQVALAAIVIAAAFGIARDGF